MTARTIDITEADIEAGHIGSCYDCPAALALQRAFPGSIVAVYGSSIHINACRFETEVGHPLRLFIDEFDHDDPVEPMSFEIPADMPCRPGAAPICKGLSHRIEVAV